MERYEVDFGAGNASVHSMCKRPSTSNGFRRTLFNEHQIFQLYYVCLCWTWKSVNLIVIPKHGLTNTKYLPCVVTGYAGTGTLRS